MLQLTRCPECDALAEIEERIVLASTGGPVEHAKIRCIDRHWFLLPVSALDPVVPGPAPQVPADARRPVAPWHRDR